MFKFIVDLFKELFKSHCPECLVEEVQDGGLCEYCLRDLVEEYNLKDIDNSKGISYEQ